MSKSNPVDRIRADAFEKARPELAEHAEAIRALGKRVLSDVLEIGERLVKARALIAHGDWLRWIEDEFGWSDQTARNFMNVADLAKCQTVLNLDLPLGALYLLARPSTPEEVRAEIIERSNGGEIVTAAEVRERIAASFRTVDTPPVRMVTVQTVYETHEIRSPVPNVTYERLPEPPAPVFTTVSLAAAQVDAGRDLLIGSLTQLDGHLMGDKLASVVAVLTPAERAGVLRIVSRFMTALEPALRSPN